MTKKEEITTVAQHHYDEFASEFTNKETDGVNSLLTPSPQGDHKKHCAKLDCGVDAVAKEDSRLKFKGEPYHLHLFIGQLEEIIREKRAILDSIGYYEPVKMGLANPTNH